ncbi:LysR family transcriptional regulator [Anaeromicrobium sediminis]|nr:LysR family transcriptional regulator [Anaeromicrobium sediminis]
METKLLRTFLVVAQNKSFSKGAEILNYAQSSISDQIRKLENQLDTKLFERLGHDVYLTKDGETLLFYAKKILNLCEEAQNTISSSSSIIKGKLTIAMTESLCVFKYPKLFRDYRSLYPHVDLKIKIGHCYEFPNWIRKNMIDVAFSLNKPSNHPDIIEKALCDEPLTLIVNKNHPFTKEKYLVPSDLINENFILTQRGSHYRTLFEQYLGIHGVMAKSTLEFESIAAIKQLVKSGFGLSFLPRVTVKEELANKELFEVLMEDKTFSIPNNITYHKDKWISPPINALFNLVDKSTQ